MAPSTASSSAGGHRRDGGEHANGALPGPRLQSWGHSVAGARDSALATASSLTLQSVGGLATGRPRPASLAPRRAALPSAALHADCPPSCREATRLGRVGCCAMGRRVHVSRFGHPRASPRVAVTSPHTNQTLSNAPYLQQRQRINTCNLLSAKYDVPIEPS